MGVGHEDVGHVFAFPFGYSVPDDHGASRNDVSHSSKLDDGTVFSGDGRGIRVEDADACFFQFFLDGRPSVISIMIAEYGIDGGFALCQQGSINGWSHSGRSVGAAGKIAEKEDGIRLLGIADGNDLQKEALVVG